MNFKKLLFLVILTLAVLTPKLSHAQGFDLLGEVTKPLLGPARDKAAGITRYLWLQPYGGYATGDGTINNSKTGRKNLKAEGMMYGVRGGFTLFDSFRVGMDYTIESTQRDEPVTNSAGTTTAQEKIKSNDSMLGFSASFAIPYTPLQAYGARYFKSSLGSDSSSGNGWGGGISFVLKNPFILIVEKRTLKYTSPTNSNSQTNDRTLDQYFIGLSFLLL